MGSRDFEDFIENVKKNCFAVVGEAGVGKTNLFCRLSEDMNEKYPTLFYNGSYLDAEKSIDEHIMDDFSLQFGIQKDFKSIIKELNNLMMENNMFFIVFIDAVNEFTNLEKLKIDIANLLNDLVKVDAYNIKFCISCRDISWGNFFIKNNKILEDNLYAIPISKPTLKVTDDEKNCGVEQKEVSEKTEKQNWATLRKFDEAEFEESWKNYKKFFNLSGEPQKNIKEICKQPLMLRFLCEGYRGKKVPEDIRSLDIFDAYWDRKVMGNETPEGIKDFLFAILKKMRNNSKAELSKTVVQKTTQMTTDANESIFNRVLDENIIMYRRREGRGRSQIVYIGFTYEAFFEYAMAKMILT